MIELRIEEEEKGKREKNEEEEEDCQGSKFDQTCHLSKKKQTIQK